MKVMLQAKHLDMLNGQYAFIVYELLLDKCLPSFVTAEDKEACEALQGILDISLYVPQDKTYTEFSELVREKMNEEPFFKKMDRNSQVNLIITLVSIRTILFYLLLHYRISNAGKTDNSHRYMNEIA